MSKYLMVFLTIVLVTFGIYSFSTDINTAADTKSGQYSSYLTAATHDAAKEIQSETTGQITMPTVSDRERAANAFFNSLRLDFGYVTDEDMQKLHVYVPVLALIDSDGYYICFNQQYTNEDGITSVTQSITSINTWTKTSGDVSARYYLGSDIDVTNDSKVYSGKYNEVYEQLVEAGVSADALSDLGLTGKEEDFLEVQRSVIIEELQEKIEYYINKNNDFAAEYTPSYTFTMPQTDKDDWTRLVANPTCIAFLQGIRVSNSKDYLNIYSIGGGEVKKANVVGYSKSEDGTTYNTAGVTKDDDGYVPTAKDAAKEADASDTFIDREPTTVVETVPHVHWGNPSVTRSSDEIGCYTKPVYHEHTSECYTTYKHRHHDASGQEIAEEVEWISVDGKYYDKNNKEISKSQAVRTGDETHVDARNINNCFTEEILHVHTDSCYTIQYHKHTDSCYKTVVVDNSGSTPKTVKVLSCGYYAYDPETDELLDLTDNEKEALESGLLSREYFIEKAQVKKTLTCGKTEGELDGYRRACKKSDGQYDGQLLTCGLKSLTDEDVNGDVSKLTVSDIDHYEIGCGYKEGQKVTKEVAEKINQPG